MLCAWQASTFINLRAAVWSEPRSVQMKNSRTTGAGAEGRGAVHNGQPSDRNCFLIMATAASCTEATALAGDDTTHHKHTSATLDLSGMVLDVLSIVGASTPSTLRAAEAPYQNQHTSASQHTSLCCRCGQRERWLQHLHQYVQHRSNTQI
jgi:hypothetical protein